MESAKLTGVKNPDARIDRLASGSPDDDDLAAASFVAGNCHGRVRLARRRWLAGALQDLPPKQARFAPLKGLEIVVVTIV